MMEKGCVHIYCGDGKGKTTAAMGLALRAAGQGFAVGIAQFLKDGRSGECLALSGVPGLHLFPFLPQVPFTFAMTPEQRQEAARFYAGLLDTVGQRRELDLVVLDEVLDAVGTGLLKEEALLSFLRIRPQGQEVVLTGRNPSARLQEAADYITDMRALKHPYVLGQAARRGIEW